MTQTATLVASPRRSEAASRFREDIEGMRAIAVLFVVLWHAGVPFLGGGFIGVDVFFVISGFLMTAMLYRGLRDNGKINLLDFYARRIKRLLPASGLALVVILLASYLFLPASRLGAIALDALFAGLYVVNWRFSETSVDYLAQTDSASPVQHFWSLSVEEQFYIFWPIIVAALGYLVVRRYISAHKALLLALSVSVAASLAWSIYMTEIDPARAYFVTATRIWELGLGGVVAVSLVGVARIGRLVSAIFAWLGLAAILASGVVYTTEMSFPGWIALAPTVGAALLIAFSPQAGSLGPAPLLSRKALVWLGSISYSWYLWHWPVIVIGSQLITDGTRAATVPEGVALAALSILPAWLSLRFVENPLRRAQWTNVSLGNVYFLGLLITSLVVATSMILALTARHPEPYAASAIGAAAGIADGRDDKPVGAQTLGDDPNSSPNAMPVDQVEHINPAPAVANRVVQPHRRCHSNLDSSEFRVCELGVPGANTTVAIMGDSHAGQWVAPAIAVAKRNGWGVRAATKGACPLVDAELTTAEGADYVSCREWYESAMEWLTGVDAPDVLLLSHSNYKQFAAEGLASFEAGEIRTIDRIRDAGVSVALIRDTPYPGVNVAECVEANVESLRRCVLEKSEVLSRRDSVQPQVASQTGVPVIDLTDWICPGSTCPPVIGNTLVWRDSNHLSLQYALSLVDELERQLVPVVTGAG